MKTWTKPEATDIRATWVKNWPKQTQDAVYTRLKRLVEAKQDMPMTMKITTVKSGTR